MSVYHLFFENPDVQDYLLAGGYDSKSNIFKLVLKGDVEAAEREIPRYVGQAMGLYRKLTVGDVKECLLLVLAQVSAVAVLGGISDWEANRTKRSYYLGIDRATELQALETLNTEFLSDFVRVVDAHNRQNAYSPFIQELQEYIRKNIEDKLTIPLLAREFHCSESSLSHRFKEETGSSVMEYVQFQKVAVSKPMIRQNLPLSQVAQQLSFSSQSHFSKVFRAVTGRSPLEWKQNPV